MRIVLGLRNVKFNKEVIIFGDKSVLLKDFSQVRTSMNNVVFGTSRSNGCTLPINGVQ